MTLKVAKVGTTPTLKVDLRSGYSEFQHYTRNSSVRSEAQHSMTKNKNLLFNKGRAKQKRKEVSKDGGSQSRERDNTAAAGNESSSRLLKTSASVRLLTVNLNATNKKSSVVKKLNLDAVKKSQEAVADLSSRIVGIGSATENQNHRREPAVLMQATNDPVIRSARLKRHLQASRSPKESPSRYSSASRLLENARFIEQGHLDSLIKSTMKSVERIIHKESSKQ